MVLQKIEFRNNEIDLGVQQKRYKVFEIYVSLLVLSVSVKVCDLKKYLMIEVCFRFGGCIYSFRYLGSRINEVEYISLRLV